MLDKVHHTRRKHYHGDTLRAGEGKLMMNNGRNNKEFEETVVMKRSFDFS